MRSAHETTLPLEHNGTDIEHPPHPLNRPAPTRLIVKGTNIALRPRSTSWTLSKEWLSP
jgi:hypothetical protein